MQRTFADGFSLLSMDICRSALPLSDVRTAFATAARVVPDLHYECNSSCPKMIV